MKYAVLIVVIGMLALGCTVEAQEPTPTPDPRYAHCEQFEDALVWLLCNAETPANAVATATALAVSPTPTPLATHPVARACSDFTDLVHDAWWGMVDDEVAQRLMRLPQGSGTEVIAGRLLAIAKSTEDYPVINRALKAAFRVNLPDSHGRGGHEHRNSGFSAFDGE